MAKKTEAKAETKKSYLVDGMLKPLIAMYELGNPKVINSQFAFENGCTTEHFGLYIQQILKLHKAVSMVIFANNMTNAEIVEAGGTEKWNKSKKALVNTVFKAWKDLLECSEEEAGNKLHCNPDDVMSLIGCCEIIVDERNLPELKLVKGASKEAKKYLDDYATLDMPAQKIEIAKIGAEAYDFAKDIIVVPSKKVLATKTFTKFRKDVEIRLGIRLAEARTLTIGQRNYILDEKRLINRINNARKEIERLEKEIEKLESVKKYVNDDATLENLETEIKRMQARINGTVENETNLETKIKKALDDLAKLHESGIDEEATDWKDLKD